MLLENDDILSFNFSLVYLGEITRLTEENEGLQRKMEEMNLVKKGSLSSTAPRYVCIK